MTNNFWEFLLHYKALIGCIIVGIVTMTLFGETLFNYYFTKKIRRKTTIVVLIVLLVVFLFLKGFAKLYHFIKSLLGNSENISLNGYEDYLVPLIIVSGISWLLWYYRELIKKRISKISKSSLSSGKINHWNWFWNVVLIMLSAFVVLFVTWIVFALFSLWTWIFGVPEKRASWGFTEEEYALINSQPSQGGEVFHLGKNPNNTQQSTDSHEGHLQISFGETYHYDKGAHFHVPLDKPGMKFIPSDTGVWYTLSFTHVETGAKETLSIMKEIVNGQEYLHTPKVVRGNVYYGEYCVTSNRDITFSLRSQSNSRAIVVYD